MPLDHLDFGKAFPCECTLRELEKGRPQRLLRYSNLGSLSRFTFDNLVPTGRSSDPANQKRFLQAYNTALAYAEKPEGWFVLVGPSGCGKTHLAAAIASHRIQQGFPALFVVVPDLLDHLRSTYAPDSPYGYDELLESVRETPFLILDDLGTQNTTPWAQEKLFQVLNHRFNLNLPTVVTARSLEEQEERLRTRLQDPRSSRVFTLETTEDTIMHGLDRLDLPMIAEMTFESFDPRGLGPVVDDQGNLERVFRAVRRWADDPQGWLVLVGRHGCGKTHLAAAVAHYRRRQGDTAIFIIVSELLDYLRSTYSPDSKVSYDRVFEKIKSVPLLVLDDFGEHSATPWAAEKLYQLFNHRYNAKLPTIVTSSLSLDEIDEKIDSSISSRLAHAGFSVIINIDAPDYRSGVKRPPKTEESSPRRKRSR